MGLFRITTKTTQPERSPEQHPAFRLGAWAATYLLRLEQRLANGLNQGQHRIGFRLRNAFLALLALFFLLYFIALLTQ
jgi:hypothetical protein